MDIAFFLKQRTAFVRANYDRGARPYLEIQGRIETQEPPYDQVSYSEVDTPPFLEEWIDARTGLELHSRASVSLLSDSFKLYLNALQRQVIGFAFDKMEKAILKKSFVAGYRVALGKIFHTDWSDCPVRFDVIEQVVLVRNLSQHGTHLPGFQLTHDAKTLRDHPAPFFVDAMELRAWKDSGGDVTFLRPSVMVTRDALFTAADQIDALADWLEERYERIDRWRAEQASAEDDGLSQVYGLFAAARSALDLSTEALALFEARRPGIIGQDPGIGVIVDGRRLERSHGGPLADRGLIGAQAFLSNLVIVENCVAKLADLLELPIPAREGAERALGAIRIVIDREVRNTGEHIDDRVGARADQGLISMSIFEPDLLCSTRADGTVGAVAINSDTLAAVARALNSLLPPFRSV